MREGSLWRDRSSAVKSNWRGSRLSSSLGRQIHESSSSRASQVWARRPSGPRRSSARSSWHGASWTSGRPTPKRLSRTPDSGTCSSRYPMMRSPCCRSLQRQALRVALLRAEPEGPNPDARAVAVACLNTLRSLSAAGPVVVAVDDIQWLDPPSAQALGFAIRRLDGDSILFLLARRLDVRAVPWVLTGRSSTSRKSGSMSVRSDSRRCAGSSRRALTMSLLARRSVASRPAPAGTPFRDRARPGDPEGISVRSSQRRRSDPEHPPRPCRGAHPRPAELDAGCPCRRRRPCRSDP